MSAGPVLMRSQATTAIVAALRDLNPTLEVIDRGSYVRVSALGECRLTRAAVERHLGRPFVLPCDLERTMASFSGHFRVDEDEACWSEGGAS
jgi:MmoB/DmpM family protein